MSEIEIDLQMLEDMCSELEEYSMLLDREMNVLWINPLLRKEIGFNIKDCFTDSLLIKSVLMKRHGLKFDIVRRSFQTGRLLKTHLSYIKMTSMPIKYGAEVLYVLLMIDSPHIIRTSMHAPLHDSFASHGVHSPNDRKSLKDIVISDDPASSDVHLSSDAHLSEISAIIGHFINDSGRMILVTSNNSVIAMSAELSRMIGRGPLRKFIFENFHDPSFSETLKDLLKMSYDIKTRMLIKESVSIGQIYEFTKKKLPSSLSRSYRKSRDLNAPVNSKKHSNLVGIVRKKSSAKKQVNTNKTAHAKKNVYVNKNVHAKKSIYMHNSARYH